MRRLQRPRPARRDARARRPPRLRAAGHRPLRPRSRSATTPPARCCASPPTRPRTRRTCWPRSSPASLARMRFPLGELTKPEVRRDRGRRRAAGREQGRLPGPLLPRRAPTAGAVPGPPRRGRRRRPGTIVDADGAVVGRHDGQHRFTVGQRRGLGIAAGEPLYVLDKDADRQRVRRAALGAGRRPRRRPRGPAAPLRRRASTGSSCATAHEPLAARLRGEAPAGRHPSADARARASRSRRGAGPARLPDGRRAGGRLGRRSCGPPAAPGSSRDAAYTCIRVTSDEIRRTFLEFFEARDHLAAALGLAGPGRARSRRRCSRSPGCIRSSRTSWASSGRPTRASRPARRRFAPSTSRSSAPRPASHVLRDARQLLVRRLLQARGGAVRVGAVDATGFGFPAEDIWITVFAGDDELGLGPDEEAIEAWLEIGVPRERIVECPRSENFWQAGPTGPCGPCSELYLDRGVEFGQARRPSRRRERALPRVLEPRVHAVRPEPGELR